MIRSFGDAATADVFHGRMTSRARRFPRDILPGAVRKLDVINAAKEINDLKSPPGNHLELLKGDLAGYWSIRINDQWRIIFRWEISGAEQVSIIDYH